MKKRGITVLTVLLLSIMLVACGDNANQANNNNDENVVENNEHEEAEEVETVETEEVEETIEAEESTGLALGLSNFDLLQAIADAVRPDKLMIVAELTSDGMTMTQRTYIDGDKERLEIEIPGSGNSIQVDLIAENVSYIWTEGMDMGMKSEYEDADDDAFIDITEDEADDVVVRLEILDGEEVIYVETVESTEEGVVTAHLWYSVKYDTLLRYEEYHGDSETPETTLIVTEIDDNSNIDPSLFVAPENVTFYEF